jgi:hypothetical protein
MEGLASCGGVSGDSAEDDPDAADFFYQAIEGQLMILDKRMAFQQVLGGVAAYCQLREDNQLTTAFPSPHCSLDDFCAIVGEIADMWIYLNQCDFHGGSL